MTQCPFLFRSAQHPKVAFKQDGQNGIEALKAGTSDIRR